MARWLTRIGRLNKRNLATLRNAPLAEVSGSLGDLGTLLPLMIALAMQGSIELGSTLVFSGLFNILTGLLFGIPLPVQPMKVRHNYTYCSLRRPQLLLIAMKLSRLSHLRPSRDARIHPSALS